MNHEGADDLHVVGRWQAAASEIAEDVRFEREAAAQLAQPGSLSSEDEASGLVRELLQRGSASGGVPCSQQLLQRVVERCADRSELPLLTFVSLACGFLLS